MPPPHIKLDRGRDEQAVTGRDIHTQHNDHEVSKAQETRGDFRVMAQTRCLRHRMHRGDMPIALVQGGFANGLSRIALPIQQRSVASCLTIDI